MTELTNELSWQEFLKRYEQAVDELVLKFTSLKNQYNAYGLYSPIENVFGRVKTIESIIHKAKKYNLTLAQIPYKMCDIAGIRIVCQFEDDIGIIADLIRSRTDMTVEITKDYVNHPKQSGYKSMHLIVSYPMHTIEGLETVLCEIQIRTLAMDFWATIEHSLNYKYDGKIPEDISARLICASQDVEALDAEMSKIKKEIEEAQRLFKMQSEVKNNIIKYILLLNKQHMEDKADEYLKEFVKLHRTNDPVQLVLLCKELEGEINKMLD